MGRRWRSNTSFLNRLVVQQKKTTFGQPVHFEISTKVAVLQPLTLKAEILCLFLTHVIKFGLSILRGLMIPQSSLARRLADALQCLHFVLTVSHLFLLAVSGL